MRVYLHFCEVFLLPSCEPELPRDTEGGADGKQMAVEDDKVVGMDTHIIVVPVSRKMHKFMLF